MTIDTVLAQIIVADLEEAVPFYRALFGREPDLRPMDGLAEWHLDAGGGVQVYEEPERSGRSGVTIGVDDLDQQIAILDASDLVHERPIEATSVTLVSLDDPDGNRIVFTQTREPAA